jgi:hypothetical protein
MRHRSMIAGAVALALTFSLAACGDDGDDESADTTTTEASTEDTGTDETTVDDTEAEEPETTEATEDTTEDTEAEAPEGDLAGFLLTAADLGEGFAEQGYETSEDPGPCGTTIDADYPYDAIVGTVLVDEASQLGLQHEIRTYADPATAGSEEGPDVQTILTDNLAALQAEVG